jgi:hypothetical protein
MLFRMGEAGQINGHQIMTVFPWLSAASQQFGGRAIRGLPAYCPHISAHRRTLPTIHPTNRLRGMADRLDSRPVSEAFRFGAAATIYRI